MNFNYKQLALDAGDILPVDATLIRLFDSDEFKSVVDEAVKDVKKSGFWSDNSKSNYYFVKKSICGLMIDLDYLPIDSLELEDNPMYERCTIQCFLDEYKYHKKSDEEPFCRRLSTVNSREA